MPAPPAEQLSAEAPTTPAPQSEPAVSPTPPVVKPVSKPARTAQARPTGPSQQEMEALAKANKALADALK